MAELKHAVVALPIIGGIIAFIGALLPWASESGGGVSVSYNILYIIWDLGAYGSETMLLSAALDDPIGAGFVAEEMVTLGMISFVLILLAMILMIVAALAVLKEKLGGKIVGLVLIIAGVLALVAPILYYVGITSDTADFFELFPIQIGFILPILGGIIGILAGLVAVLKID